MKSLQLKSLDRFFKAKSVVFIGGKDLLVPINEIRRRKFKGKIFVVNPKRDKILGISCYKSVNELPNSPDAAFIAVPAKNVVQTVRELNQINCGGVVCYAAGFKEIGHQGLSLETHLIEACGNMPLIGPNCYGIINYIDNLALWPFAHGGFSPGYGSAVITQSGMLSSDILMTQRSLPLSFMVSVGNQAVTSIEDLITYFCYNNNVRAIGIHLEGIKNIDNFIKASNLAFNIGKPIVAYRTGKSKIGKNLTKSHTGSLSGDDDAFSALFEQLCIIEVDNPIQFIETLKFFTLCNPLENNDLIGFTCSGGGATMLADCAEKLELRFTPFSRNTKKSLKDKLPIIATVSNPLDYTTPIWGIPQKTKPVFKTALDSRNYSIAILIQDFPLSGLDDSEEAYLRDSIAFIEEAKSQNIPAVICSTFPENINKEIREKLIKLGAIPMQGINHCLKAISNSLKFSKKKSYGETLIKVHEVPAKNFENKFDEFNGKKYLEKNGVKVPVTQEIKKETDFEQLIPNFPLSLKYSMTELLHKTEAGAVKLNIQNRKHLLKEFNGLNKSLKSKFGKLDGKFFVEEMAPTPIAEMFLSLRNDKKFGKVLTIGMGGSLTELYNDASTFILPLSRKQLLEGISKLKIFKLINGFRNKEKINKNKILKDIFQLINIFEDKEKKCSYLEINPLFIYKESVVVIDCILSTQE